MLDHDPVVTDSRVFFSSLDGAVVERWENQQSPRGRPGCPEAVSLKAFLIRIREGFISTTHLRAFLVNHPLLAIALGFPLVLDLTKPYGFDIQHTLPCRSWFGEKLHKLDRRLLQDLLAAPVQALQTDIPGLGEVVSFDVKHISAWVQEHHERASVKDRDDQTKRLAGDPDCRLGVKRRTNQKASEDASNDSSSSSEATEPPEHSKRSEKKEQNELLWGDGSGVAAATTPDSGNVVLAE